MGMGCFEPVTSAGHFQSACLSPATEPWALCTVVPTLRGTLKSCDLEGPVARLGGHQGGCEETRMYAVALGLLWLS